MGKKTIFATLIATVIGGVFFFSSWQKKSPQVIEPAPTQVAVHNLTSVPKEKIADYKASFAIFTNGTFRVFTVAMYHNLSEDVFIQADNPNIVHVKKNGITWNDFFKTLPFKLAKDCLTTGTGETFCNNGQASLKFYINGVKTDDLLEKEIKNGDRTLITYGSESDVEIQRQIEKVANPNQK